MLFDPPPQTCISTCTTHPHHHSITTTLFSTTKRKQPSPRNRRSAKFKTTANNKALEALIDGDGEWDALVVERDTPVMDGFEIASGLRDFEKARRNRASTVRAAAVERHGHTKGGGGLERDSGGETSSWLRLATV